VTIANRTLARAADLARRLEDAGPLRATVASLDALEDGLGLSDVRLVVNTTSTGLGNDPIAVRHGATPHDCLFMDLVYGAQPTPFLRAAARGRRRTLDGSGMLLHQGALAFETWTGLAAPLDAMRRALGDAGYPSAPHRPPKDTDGLTTRRPPPATRRPERRASSRTPSRRSASIRARSRITSSS
jgi:shikimate dehydrogenase